METAALSPLVLPPGQQHDPLGPIGPNCTEQRLWVSPKSERRVPSLQRLEIPSNCRGRVNGREVGRLRAGPNPGPYRSITFGYGWYGHNLGTVEISSPPWPSIPIQLPGWAPCLSRWETRVSSKQSATHADGDAAIHDNRTYVERPQPIVRHSQSMPEPMQYDHGGS